MVDSPNGIISSQANSIGDLDRLVDALPEMYQPIYGHPELSVRVCREGDDRLSSLISIYRALEGKLGRPVRVLDLGCAQGFFSLSLAKLGAVVSGIDFEARNIAVCKALADEHPGFHAHFETGLIEEFLATMASDQYDLVLGLSVFHHLVHRLGITAVQQILAVLANKSVAAILELALASEPLYWAASQPQSPRRLLDGYAFVHEFAWHKSHLSPSYRPLFIASNRYWFLNDQAEAFDTWQAGSHTFTHNNGTRRYFCGNGLIAKLFTLDDEAFHGINLQEHINEIKFLDSPPSLFKAPRLFLYGRHQREAWLVREQVPGELLFDKIRHKKPYDAQRVIKDTLEQLALLEAAGLYHDDLRIWNILVDEDSHARVMDYGSIAGDKKDRGWPYNLFLSFMIFMHDVIYSAVTISNPIRSTAFNPQSFPAPYCHILWKLYERSPADWSFALMRDILHEPTQKYPRNSAPARESFIAVMQIMENACAIHQNAAVYWRQKAKHPGSISSEALFI
jgi:O-antigen chain-terminating methyltransferase